MTLRSKLTMWYAGFLSISCILIGIGLYYELVIEPRKWPSHVIGESASTEIDEILLFYAVPAFLFTLIAGWWITRRALSPVQQITSAASRIGLENLGAELPRTGNNDEIDRLAEVFNSMFKRLKDSYLREREFMLHASHELKTPLTVMRAQIETALGDSTLTIEQKELLQNHVEEISRLATLVDSLSFLAKADAGMLVLRKKMLPLDALVRDFIEDLKALAYPRQIEVRFCSSEPIQIMADPHRIRQLLLNLGENAVKHNHPNGWIEISLTKTGGLATLTIRNSGNAINPEELNRLFDPLYRGHHARENDVEGSGLGLSIAQWIVHSHHGSIKITSEKDQPTTATVQLPI